MGLLSSLSGTAGFHMGSCRPGSRFILQTFSRMSCCAFDRGDVSIYTREPMMDPTHVSSAALVLGATGRGQYVIPV